MTEVQRHIEKHGAHPSKKCRYCIKFSGMLTDEQKTAMLAKLDER